MQLTMEQVGTSFEIRNKGRLIASIRDEEHARISFKHLQNLQKEVSGPKPPERTVMATIQSIREDFSDEPRTR